MVDVWYNISNLSTSVNVIQMARVANDVTLGWYGIFIVLGSFFVTFFSMKQYSNKAASQAAATLAVVLSILLRSIGLVSSYVMFISIILVSACAAWLM